MDRIVLRHLSGSKVNQVEEFPLAYFKDLSIGRDSSCAVKYDPDRDDLVGRVHARIYRNESNPQQFQIVDLDSRNGTFVNSRRIAGASLLQHGDVIQFGPGGPKLQFELEPRTEHFMRPTRSATDPYDTLASRPGIKPTRDGNLPGSGVSLNDAVSDRELYHKINNVVGGGAPGFQPQTVGKATVERMILGEQEKSRKQMRKQMAIVIGALFVLVIMVAGGWAYLNWRNPQPVVVTTPIINPAEIAKRYSKAVVYIEVGWKLYYTPTGKQIYHQYIRNEYKVGDAILPIIPNRRQFLIPVYAKAPNGKIEPMLDESDTTGAPIGTEHNGTGFLVSTDGFILTNRHVAAPWRNGYTFPDAAQIGALVDERMNLQFGNDGRPILAPAPSNDIADLDKWVPSEDSMAAGRLQGGLEGRLDYINVVFPNSGVRIPARLVGISQIHDVAMIKIDVPQSLPKVDYFDGYDVIQQGAPITVLGYPALSPPRIGVPKKQDPFSLASNTKIMTIPGVTLSQGSIGRIHRDQEKEKGKASDGKSLLGDVYQLTVNSTGEGNSGGPVFDEQGRVIAIFFAGSPRVTYAVPIRYGLELMGAPTR